MAKKPGAGGIIFLAIIVGLIFAYALYSYLHKMKESSEANWKPVVVAVVDIKPRTTITRDMITPSRFPQENIAPDAVDDIKKVEGKIALGRIKAKEQIRESDLLQKGQSPSLAYQIPPGKRAIAIAAGEVMAAGSSVKPGDHVDILATYVDPVVHQETTQMILQNVSVLAVNKGQTDAAGQEGASSSMTLAVAPDEAELLTAADRAGVLRVALRPVQDDNVVESSGTKISDIVRARIQEAAAQAQAQRTQVQSDQPKATPIIVSPQNKQPRSELKIYRGVQEQVVQPD